MKKYLIILTTVIMITANTAIAFADSDDVESAEAAETETTENNAQFKVPQDESLPLLTLETAVKRAKANSSSLKSVNESIELNKKELEDLGNEITVYATNGSATYIDSSSRLNSVVSMVKALASEVTNKLDKTVAEETIEYNVIRLFISIVNAERDYYVSQLELENLQADIKISEVKLNLGLISENQLLSEKINYETSLKSLSEKKTTLDKAYVELNLLLGYNAGEKYRLDMDSVEYEPLGEIDIDHYVIYKTATDPDIAKKEKTYETAEYQTNFYTDGQSVREKEINAAKASRDIADAKTELEQKIRNQYSSLQSSEKSIQNEELQLEKAYKDLDINKVSLSLGKVTELDVKKTETDIASKEASLLNAKANYYISLLAFEKPYLN